MQDYCLKISLIGSYKTKLINPGFSVKKLLMNYSLLGTFSLPDLLLTPYLVGGKTLRYGPESPLSYYPAPISLDYATACKWKLRPVCRTIRSATRFHKLIRFWELNHSEIWLEYAEHYKKNRIIFQKHPWRILCRTR